jgi:hypothetical protein
MSCAHPLLVDSDLDVDLKLDLLCGRILPSCLTVA